MKVEVLQSTSNRSQMFYKIGFLKNFGKFTGRHIYQGLSLQLYLKIDYGTGVFYEFCEIFDSTLLYRISP